MFDKSLFDYIYYRLYQANRNKGPYQGVPAIVVISVVQGLFGGGLLAILVRSIYDRATTAPYAKPMTNVFLLLMALVMILNYSIYKNKYSQLEERWKRESARTRVLKGFIIAFVIIAAFVPLIFIGLWF
jgi:hypothetical protein